MDKKGIPKEVIDHLDIHKVEESKPIEVNVIVEKHQARIPIPREFRLELNLEEGSTKCVMSLKKAERQLVCQF